MIIIDIVIAINTRKYYEIVKIHISHPYCACAVYQMLIELSCTFQNLTAPAICLLSL